MFPPESSSPQATSTTRSTARGEVERARLMSDVRDLVAILRGQPNELLPFEWVKHLAPQGEHSLGVQAIEVAHIIGSVDRYREFDRHYLPKEKHLDERWIGVRSAQLQGKELPPIQVYKVGELYFVKDGNHRVSVARRQGQAYIDAHVIELNVTVPPEESDTLTDLIIKGEYAQFLRATGLDVLVPGHREILFTTPGRYDKLLEHIRTRQYFLDRKPERAGLPPVTWEEAVVSWYERLYLRIVDNLDLHHVMFRFPGRTEADLYLWTMDHRYFLTQKYGHDVGSEEAARDFGKRHSPPAYKRLGQRMQLLLRGKLDSAM
ncbi:transcriptional regulator [Deinococcus sp. AJ005]|uniref:transcriptional regulator n=1 Tax=Deinococcus sp. AJ005 TaxID=2652443 RepID=UPI00125CC1C9|nr:transcriptional regulator [Deinococcus sp. AJ005]QFP76201.1 transcriptional regulator [Deinococcus sp. AJ005]